MNKLSDDALKIQVRQYIESAVNMLAELKSRPSLSNSEVVRYFYKELVGVLTEIELANWHKKD